MIKIKKNSIYTFGLLFIFSLVTGFVVHSYILHQQKAASLYPGLRLLQKNEDPEDYVREQAKVCAKLKKEDKASYICLRSAGKMLADQVPFKTIVSALHKSTNDCHSLMHNVVNEEYKKGTKLPEIWQYCTDACFGACYHGGFEGLFSSSDIAQKNELEKADFIKAICESVKDKYNNLYYQCFHGMGHAFMLLHDGDLYKSLKTCDSVSSEWRENCYGGVFMENLPNSTTAGHTAKLFIKEDDPMYPCNSLEKKYQQTCYSFQASYFFYISKRNSPKVIGLCQNIPGEYIKWCFNQLGLMQINHKSSDQSKAKHMCSLVQEGGLRESCITGVINGYIDRFPNNFAEMRRKGIFEFCEDTESRYKTSCYLQIGEILSSFMNKNDRELACKDIKEVNYRKYCQSGKLVSLYL